MVGDRFERQIPFLTPEGQARLGNARVAVVGLGGLGSHVVQQLAYAGVVNLSLIDHDRVSRNNLNRLVTGLPDDVGSFKVDVLRRFVVSLNPGASTQVVRAELRSLEAFAVVKAADYLVGCIDDDGPRFLLNQLAAAYQKPYMDLSSEIGADRTSYGGKIVFTRPGHGCLSCRGLLDDHEIAAWLETPDEQRTRKRIYGQLADSSTGSGPSVVALNGVVASLGVMELMVEIAGIRAAHEYLVYRGVHGLVVRPEEYATDPTMCRICAEVCGQGDAADLERFIRDKSLLRLPPPEMAAAQGMTSG